MPLMMPSTAWSIAASSKMMLAALPPNSSVSRFPVPDDAELPADCLLGPLHGGWGVGMAVLTNERGHIGASIIGLERRMATMAAMAEGRELSPEEAAGEWIAKFAHKFPGASGGLQ